MLFSVTVGRHSPHSERTSNELGQNRHSAALIRDHPQFLSGLLLAAASSNRSATSEMSLPMIPGLGPTGLSTAPGRLTKAAAQPAASAPEMSQACAAIRQRLFDRHAEALGGHEVRSGRGLELGHLVRAQHLLEEVSDSGVADLSRGDARDRVGQSRHAKAVLVKAL